jgi:hypothetical protein
MDIHRQNSKQKELTTCKYCCGETLTATSHCRSHPTQAVRILWKSEPLEWGARFVECQVKCGRIFIRVIFDPLRGRDSRPEAFVSAGEMLSNVAPKSGLYTLTHGPQSLQAGRPHIQWRDCAHSCDQPIASDVRVSPYYFSLISFIERGLSMIDETRLLVKTSGWISVKICRVAR